MKGLVVVFAALVGSLVIFASQSAASASVSLSGISKAKPGVSSPITPIQLKDKDDDDVKPPKDKPKKSKKDKDDDDDKDKDKGKDKDTASPPAGQLP